MLPAPRPERLLANIRSFSTAELLDRVTVLKTLMDPDALDVMLAELAGRGIGPEEIGVHLREMRFKFIKHADGHPATCHTCGRAAVLARKEWHRLLGLVPLFLRTRYWCQEHS